MVPNLFLLGAGKCGTTTLHKLLSLHPDIHACEPKEPSFFCSQFQVVSNPIDYLRLFDTDCRYRMDSSHVYFSNPESASALASLFPDAKFILIFRDPIQRSLSLYQHMRRKNRRWEVPLETKKRFIDALKAEEHRASSPEFFKNCKQYFYNYLYVRSSRYDEQLERYLELFDRSAFFVTTLAALKGDSEVVIREILEFLELDLSRIPSLPKKPENIAMNRIEMDDESYEFLDKEFAGQNERVNQLVGKKLDWSL